MSRLELVDMTALEYALNEYQMKGQEEFLAKHGFNQPQRYYIVHKNALFGAKAVVNAAYRYLHGGTGGHILRGGERQSNHILRDLGFKVVDGRPATVEGELGWRIAVWNHLLATEDPNRVPPKSLHRLRAYYGGQGVWVDAKRTSAISAGGVTMGILHTGVHYPDRMEGDRIFYHYPRTQRGPGRDASEIEATKMAGRLKLPIFVVAKPTPSSAFRTVRMAWVEGWDDDIDQFLLSYQDVAPEIILDHDVSDEDPFLLTGNRSRHKERKVQVRPDQARFKLQVFQRYGARCPLSGIGVPQMIEAAHLRPVPDNGSDDPRNGIPLSAGLHRAFDANLFAIHPETLEVVIRPDGPTAAQMHLKIGHLRDLPKPPHREALEWRYNRWAAHAHLNRGSHT